jgi:hypothetical protein
MGNASQSPSPITRRRKIFPFYIPVGEEIFPSLSPNGGITHGESGIGALLPSLVIASMGS